MPLTAREIIKLLKKHNYVEIRQVGSHKQFFNKEQNRKVTVPVHPGDLPKGTEKAILKQAGINK